VLFHTAALSALVVACLIVGVLAGRYVLVGVLIPVQMLLALVWLAVLSTPALWWSALYAVGTAVVADLLMATGPTGVRRLAGALGVALLLALALQVLRRDPRVALTASLTAGVTATTFAVGLAVLVALRRTGTGRDAALAALVGTGAAILVARSIDAWRTRRILPGGRRRSATAVVVAGGVALLAGAVIGAVVGPLGVGDGVTLAAACAAVALACDVGLDLARAGLPDDRHADRARAALLPLSVLLPVALAAPAAYVTGRLLLG
jgi:hypothetical protein